MAHYILVTIGIVLSNFGAICAITGLDQESKPGIISGLFLWVVGVAITYIGSAQ